MLLASISLFAQQKILGVVKDVTNETIEDVIIENGLHLNAESYKVWATILKNGHYF